MQFAQNSLFLPSLLSFRFVSLNHFRVQLAFPSGVHRRLIFEFYIIRWRLKMRCSEPLTCWLSLALLLALSCAQTRTKPSDDESETLNLDQEWRVRVPTTTAADCCVGVACACARCAIVARTVSQIGLGAASVRMLLALRAEELPRQRRSARDWRQE